MSVPRVGSVTAPLNAVFAASVATTTPASLAATVNCTLVLPLWIVMIVICALVTARSPATSALKFVSKAVRSAEPGEPATVSMSPARLSVAVRGGVNSQTG